MQYDVMYGTSPKIIMYTGYARDSVYVGVYIGLGICMPHFTIFGEDEAKSGSTYG